MRPVLHDPTGGSSRRVEAAWSDGDLELVDGGRARRVAGAGLRLVGSGWRGDAVTLAWDEEGQTWALTFDPADAAGLRAGLPAQLAAAAGVRDLDRVRARRRRRWAALGLAAGLLVLGLAAALVLAVVYRDALIAWAVDRLPASVDVRIGQLVEGQVRAEGRLVAGGPALQAVEQVGSRLLAAARASEDREGFSFRFAVARDPSVNAFAAPGGFVVVHSGLLAAAETPEELAGVLAHEITHVRERHSLRQMVVKLGLWGLLQVLVGAPEGVAETIARAAIGLGDLGFSRDQERAADRGGLELLRAARVPASGLVSFFARMEKEAEGGRLPALLASHPAPAERRESWALAIAERGPWPVEPLGVDWAAAREQARALGAEPAEEPAGPAGPAGEAWR